jgi:protein-S-isoprenylcysteine O-methyltransferase Ste14
MEDMNFHYAGPDSKKRIVHTRLFALVIFLLLITSGNKIQSGLREGLLDFAGLACVIVSSFGRAWTSIYIAGYKSSDLVEVGPYSVTRNPLYLFSLIGAAGIGMASGSLLILVLFVLAFGLYYPFVIRREEKELKGWHGPEFLSYIERVPRFLPKMSLYSEPDTYLVKTKNLKKALLDASYFLWIYGALELLIRLREAGIFPVFFRIP